MSQLFEFMPLVVKTANLSLLLLHFFWDFFNLCFKVMKKPDFNTLEPTFWNFRFFSKIRRIYKNQFKSEFQNFSSKSESLCVHFLNKQARKNFWSNLVHLISTPSLNFTFNYEPPKNRLFFVKISKLVKIIWLKKLGRKFSTKWVYQKG